jgi:hypothetical protein
MIRFSKIKLIFGCCLLLVLFNSCKPKGVLSRKEMVSVLVDLHLTEAAVGGIGGPIPEEWLHGLDVEYFKDMSYRSVLRKHHLSQEDFYTSVSWYSRHMNLYEKIYIDVQGKLDEFMAAIDEGKFDNSSNMSRYGLDTVKTRSLYTYGQFRRDSIPVRYFYLIGDSLPSSSAWYTKQWMYHIAKDTTRLSLFPELNKKSVIGSLSTDSLKIKTDSLVRQNVSLQTPAIRTVLVTPGSRRFPTRNLREVPKNEQIRKRFEQRAVEQNQLKRLEMERLRKEQIDKRN